ncbi:hypothetical protein [Rossellomorea aquimaris]|uniref:hypothetical protein n=1 Tax=Rossellomorea aquimaris TaxID=189382 RepID=UPI0008FC7C8B|nr:hypothetical protein [Rossellomorea aquimaris]
MIGVLDEDSCGKSSLCETPQERMRRGGSRATRGKRSLARKSKAVLKAQTKMPPSPLSCNRVTLMVELTGMNCF